MKKLMIVAALFCTAFASCQSSKSIKSFSELDSVSYAIGIDLVDRFGIRGVEDSMLNGAVLAAAVRDAFANKPQMNYADAVGFLNEYYQVRKPAKIKNESQAWLEEVKAGNPNIQTTASGLMYEIINAGDNSIKATDDADQVVVKYLGTYKDGSEFDRNDSIAFALNGVIPAWTEGMKLIGKGGQIVLWANPDLAYFPINGNPEAMKFEVTLIDVLPSATAK